jgi:ACT domain-containing protein
MRAIITVIGHDRIGIIARIAGILAESGVNVLDISQTILQEFFTMTMLVDLSAMEISLEELNGRLQGAGEEMGLSIRVQREDLFRSMHRI